MLNRRAKAFQSIFEFVQTYEFGTFWNGELRAYDRNDRNHYYRAFIGRKGIEYVYEKNEASEPRTAEIMRRPQAIESISDFAFYLFKELSRNQKQEAPSGSKKHWGRKG